MKISNKNVDHIPFLERLVFENRIAILLLVLLITGFLGYQMAQVRPDVQFEKLIPLQHPYIQNSMKYMPTGGNAGNAVQIAVEVVDGDIFTKEYLETLRQIADDVFYTPGVDKGNMISMWSAGLRWEAATPVGWKGDAIIGSGYDGTPEAIEKVRLNVLRSRHIGTYIANNFKATIIKVPLVGVDRSKGERFDYLAFSKKLEQDIRAKYQTDQIKIHIVGFPKWIADLISGFQLIGLFFLISIGIAFVLLYIYSHCWKSSVVPLLCSIIAVVWQLGLVKLLGYGLDPYSVLVPFLVFAIGVSHGVQIISGISNEAGRGEDKLMAARRAFRVLHIPGAVAILCDVVGFSTLYMIPIQVIQELAITASLGVFVILFTNLVLLPLLMSYIGVTKASIIHAQSQLSKDTPVWNAMSRFASGKIAPVTLLISAILLGGAFYFRADLKIGDLDAGQPMLRPDSVYNKDNAYVNANFSTSSDVMVVFLKTAPDKCTEYSSAVLIDRLTWALENDHGVQSVFSMVTKAKYYSFNTTEANPKWSILARDQNLLTTQIGITGMNMDCSIAYVQVSLYDHKAETLERVAQLVQKFADENNSEEKQLLLAGGNAGIDAATNQEIKYSQNRMLLLVYAAVTVLCLITFRSILATICIITPLIITSILCEALMAIMGIGFKVATLPVVALGVGIGVDYGIYIFAKLEHYLSEGYDLVEAYLHTLRTTGKAVFFTGFTLALGVGTWVFSPIKFQADMGILLVFMFLWNMVGAVWMLPAIAHYLIKPAKYVSKQ